MKKLFYLMLLLPILLVGCKKNNVQNEEPEAVKLAIEPNSIISPSAGADYTLTLTAPEAWTATCADSWVKVTPSSGNAGTVEINVKIAADKESVEATSKIVFKSGDQTVEVPVKRLAKDPARLMIVSGTDIYTPKDGGVYSIKVESNIKWQISSNANWAKIEGNAVVRNNGVISVTVEAATTPEETVATLTISPLEGSGVEKQTVTITRSASDATSMTVNKSQIDAPADGGSYTITVNTTAKWKATKSWDADWITLSNNEKTGNGSFSIKVDPATSGNDAKTVITVEEVRSDDYKPVQLNVLVTRKGKANAELSVEPTSISSPAEGGDFTVTIKSNYAWTASGTGADLFSISISKGNGDATMVVTVKPTTQTKEETGKIVISSSYGGAQAVINIHREGYHVANIEPKNPYCFYLDDEGKKKVYFAKGNLQYNPAQKAWRFAAHQYDVLQKANEGLWQSGFMLYYDSWIDIHLFGKPVPATKGNIFIAGEFTTDIANTNDDWGVYLTAQGVLPADATSCGLTGTGNWRTLTSSEWRKIMYRKNSFPLFATVNNIKGIVVLPDNCILPSDLSITLKYSTIESPSLPLRTGHFTDNIISLSDWNKLENAGAVFLPLSGTFSGNGEWYEIFAYWSSSVVDKDGKKKGNALLVEDGGVISTYPYDFDFYYPVRLVQDAN